MARVRVLGYKLERIAGHKERARPSVSLNPWAGASAQHRYHAQRPVCKGESSLRLIITRLPSSVQKNEQLEVGSLERMYRFVE